MKFLDVEIKARCENLGAIREILKQRSADFKGVDHQIDTYFKVPKGRLKLREGIIENGLIYYERADKARPTETKCVKHNITDATDLKAVLTHALGVLVVVDKEREIFFIDNVKFHIDKVKNLGTFCEIEAQKEGRNGNGSLKNQVEQYMDLLNIKDNDLVSVSYSDLLLNKK